jgi:hypothetical protein
MNGYSIIFHFQRRSIRRLFNLTSCACSFVVAKLTRTRKHRFAFVFLDEGKGYSMPLCFGHPSLITLATIKQHQQREEKRKVKEKGNPAMLINCVSRQ